MATNKRRHVNLYVAYEANKGILGYYEHNLALAKLFKANPIYIEVITERLARLKKVIKQQERKLAKLELEKPVVEPIEETLV